MVGELDINSQADAAVGDALAAVDSTVAGQDVDADGVDAPDAGPGKSWCVLETGFAKCDDDEPCTQDICDEAAQKCQNIPVSGSCDDGNACTTPDACSDGDCAAGPNVCDCAVDADCAAFDDTNVCNGTLVCVPAGALFQCALDPATVVSCAVTANVCIVNQCDPAVGECVPVPVEATPCDDNDPCTVGDQCGNGVCGPGVDKCACHSDADCKPDGGEDICTGVLFCDQTALPFAACAVQLGTGVTCTTATEDAQCATTICEPKFGLCVKSPIVEKAGKPCDDGLACTFASVCEKGACAAGTTKDCADLNLCTDDTCAPTGECIHTANTLPCEDNNKCTNGETCADKQCVATAANAVPCDDNNTCTKDSCASKSGCVFIGLADGAACDDGDPCSGDGACEAGKCGAGTPKDCEDGDKCTVDEPCNGGKCGPGKPNNCDDGNACTDDSCAVKTGCQHSPNTNPCAGSAPCLAIGACTAGTCKAGKPKLFAHTLASQNARRARAVAEVASGEVWIAGSQHTPAKQGSSAVVDAFVARGKADGSTVDDNVFAAPGDDVLAGLQPLGGGAIGVGHHRGADGKPDTWVLRLDAKAAIEWSKTFGGPGDDRALAVGVSGTRVEVAGFSTTAVGQTGRLHTLDEKGAVATVFDGASGELGPLGGVTADTVGAVAVGQTRAGAGPLRAAAVRVVKGAAVWTARFGGATGPSAAVGVVAKANQWWVAGNDVSASATLPWVRALHANGEVLWARNVGKPGLGAVLALVSQPDAGVALLGATGAAATSSDAWLTRLDRTGAATGAPVFWSGPAIEGWNAVALLADTTLFAVGSQVDVDAKTELAWVGRFDPWGHATCSAAGPCAGLTAKGCGAGPCQLATCEKLLGCAKVSATLPCDDGKICTLDDACSKGVCADGTARLWTQKLAGKPGDRAAAIARLAGGDLVIVGQSSTPGKVDGMVTRLAPTGGVRWTTFWGPTLGADFAAVVAARDGTIAAAGHANSSGGEATGWLLRTGLDGTLVSLATWTEFASRVRLLGVAQRDDDGYLVVGAVQPLKGPANTEFAVLRRADVHGKALAKGVNFPIVAGARDELRAVVAAGGGEALAVGVAQSQSKGASDGWIVRVDGAGQIKLNVRMGALFADELHAVTRSVGGFVVAGTYGQKADRDSGWLAAVDGNANVKWTTFLPGTGPRVLAAVAPHPSGFVAAGWQAFDGFSNRGWWLRTDAQLQLSAERVFPAATAVAGVVAGLNAGSADNGVDFAGDTAIAGTAPHAKSGDQGAAWAARMDSHGNVVCNDKCVAKLAGGAAQLCDDNNPCTMDLCDGGTGKCLLTAAWDGKACAPAKTCKSGVCQ